MKIYSFFFPLLSASVTKNNDFEKRLDILENYQKLLISNIRLQRARINILETSMRELQEENKQLAKQVLYFVDDYDREYDYASAGSGDGSYFPNAWDMRAALVDRVRYRKRSTAVKRFFRDKRQNSFPEKQIFDMEVEDIRDELKSWKHMKFDFLSQIRTLNENVATIESRCNSVSWLKSILNSYPSFLDYYH